MGFKGLRPLKPATNEHKTNLMKQLLAFLCIVLLSSCIKEVNPYTLVPPGRWRAVLHLEEKQPSASKEAEEEQATVRIEDVPYGQLPFLFDLTYTDDSTFYIEIINGKERIRVDEIRTWHTITNNHDSIRIDFPIYDTYILARFAEGIMEGRWYVPARGQYSIPFTAEFGKGHRFSTVRKPPAANLSGRWATVFAPNTEEAFPAIGEFQQNGNHLLGTFATETGDFRFLEGTVQGNKMYLSCFDGSHAFLFTAKIMPDSSLNGTFQSGIHYKTNWIAHKDPHARLKHPDSLTFLKPGFKTLDFAFYNPSTGDTLSLNDPAFADRPVIVQIMGTWCPNCRDETQFLVNYLQKHPEQNVAIIGLSFEKGKNPEKAYRLIQTFKEKMNVPYPILYAGPPGEATSRALPMLKKIVSYPTLIFLNKNKEVVNIHTGFYGPATEEYQRFTEEFEHYLAKITQ